MISRALFYFVLIKALGVTDKKTDTVSRKSASKVDKMALNSSPLFINVSNSVG